MRPFLAGAWLAGLLLLPFGQAASSEPAFRTLASFDVGSGSTRMLVVDVAICSGDILTVHEARKVSVAYADDLLNSDEQRFSDEIRAQGNTVMGEFSELAARLGAEQMIGVATQAFRQSGNGQQLLEDWQRDFGLDIRIVSQIEEARMAYRLVEARLESPDSGLVVWDIGAGSQQLVWRDCSDGCSDASWQHLNSTIASVSFRNRAIRQLQRPVDRQTPNPIDAEEAEQLAVELSAWLSAEEFAGLADYLAAGAEVVGIGGVHGASVANQLGLRPGEEITREAVRAALNRQLGRTDQDIGGDYANTEVSNLILVGTLMDRYGIDRYQVMPVNLTEAVLLELVDDCTPAGIGPTSIGH